MGRGTRGTHLTVVHANSVPIKWKSTWLVPSNRRRPFPSASYPAHQYKEATNHGSSWPLNAETRIQSHSSSCGFRGGQKWHWVKFSTEYFILPCQYHSPNATYWFTQLSRTLYNLSIWPCRSLVLGQVLLPNISVFACQYHSTNAPY